MIYIFFVIGVMLALGGITYWYCNYIFIEILNKFETKWPSYYSGSEWDFAVAFMRYLPLILILVGALIFVSVNSQKPKEIEYL